MKYILFVLFSSLEFFSIFMIGLILFRFKLNAINIYKVILSSVILSICSLFIRSIGLSSIAPFILMSIMSMSVYLKFKRKLLQSILISILSYFIYGIVQAILLFITDYYKVIKFSDLVPYSAKGYTLQFCTFLITVAVIYVLKRTNEGYAFDLTEPTHNVKYNSKIFMVILSIAILLSSILFEQYITYQTYLWFIIFSLIIIISSITILFISFKRDQEEFDWISKEFFRKKNSNVKLRERG